MPDRTCIECGGETPTRRHVYCSPKCKWTAANRKRYKRPPRECPACGSDVSDRHGKVVYCSPACGKWALRNPGERRVTHGPCKECGQPLPPGKLAGAVFCSRRCKNRSAERRRVRDDHARYLAERERRIEYAKAYARSHPDVGQRAKRKRKALLEGAGAFEVTARDWSRAKGRTRGTCFYCGNRRTLTMDHVIPVCQGGRHSIGNIVPCCASCNSSKNGRTIMQWKVARASR